MHIESPVFRDGERIPPKYTCDGERFLSPPFSIKEVPEGAESLVLIMDDPDVPAALRPDGNFTHWVAFNIPASTTSIDEGELIGVQGANTRGESRYTGPCPPSEYEPSTHRYFFKLYAADTMLNLSDGATKEEVLAALEGHIIATSGLMGVYSRNQP